MVRTLSTAGYHQAMQSDPSGLELAGIRFQIGIFEEVIAGAPEDTDALRYLAHAYNLMGRVDDGLATDRRLVDLLPDDPRARYNLACACALADRREEALEVLQESVRLGFLDLQRLRTDHDLDSLRADPRYVEIEQRLARRLSD